MKKKEVFSFQSEVKQLLQLMIHSLYSNKEIFLRELISNSADAIEKIKFFLLSNTDFYEKDEEFKIRISYNKEEKTITVQDNGIGMTKKEVIDNIGTIARSGTREFLRLVENKENTTENFIGQFGVGFYSSFIVSKKVIIKTRHVQENEGKGVLWESDGTGKYTIYEIEKSNIGTEVILFLKDSEEEFLDEWKIRSIVQKYSEHISIPVEILLEKKSENSKKIWEQVNQAIALWTKNKNTISNQEYKEFYKKNFQDFHEPLHWMHNKVEGSQEYISLLYIPYKSSLDLWNREQKYGLKLYVKKVFIMEHSEQFLPTYLRFIKGLIDSSDLPLNISREILQNSIATKKIKNRITKKILSELKKLSQDEKKYSIFWNQFGIILKEGITEDYQNKEKIIELLRFSSTNFEKQKVSLKSYLKNMKKEQKKIYYITSESYQSAKNSPHLEIFYKNGIEVLLLYDRIDEWMMNSLKEFDGKKIESVYKTNLDKEKIFKNLKELSEHKNTESKNLLERIKSVLKDKIKDVRLTNKLLDTPSILVTDKNEMTTQMAKLFSAAGQNVPKIQYIFEINPKHKIIKYISKISDQKDFSDWVNLLFQESMLVEQNTLENPNFFVKKINQILSKNIKIE
ncbi:molecular chaperone HtpG [bacterium endosymbiont of Pedicinus badii]|uniref:molecular chaperone HtpG n=1 Tax=bacterium endosymbiont of Pedicinus badii TaxID=1719126 RepID=UPI0009B97450|nr:molecular chaperone HtpG [bacterium endosymbiont of Pedicinus badii]OQM34298.1 heat-shock protein Hsp90 [bacterium endosymbiont of Pedicinus badii]